MSVLQESTWYQEILQEGEQRSLRQVSLNLLRQGMSVEFVADVTGLSRDRIHEFQAELSASESSSVLAGLVLEKHFIRHVLRRDIMRESVIYQEILAEGADANSVKIARNLLAMGLSVEQIARATELSVDRVRQWQQESE